MKPFPLKPNVEDVLQFKTHSHTCMCAHVYMCTLKLLFQCAFKLLSSFDSDHYQQLWWNSLELLQGNTELKKKGFPLGLTLQFALILCDTFFHHPIRVLYFFFPFIRWKNSFLLLGGCSVLCVQKETTVFFLSFFLLSLQVKDLPWVRIDSSGRLSNVFNSQPTLFIVVVQTQLWARLINFILLICIVGKLLSDLPVATSRIFLFREIQYIGKEGRKVLPLSESIILTSRKLLRILFVVRLYLSVK